MADYYTQFSFLIPVTAEKAPSVRDWLAETLEGGEDGPPCFQWEFSDNPAHFLGIQIYADDGDIEDAALLAQAYLERFDPKGRIGFQYACTCSNPRVEEFGGGIVVVTSEQIHYENTEEWLDRVMTSEKKKWRNTIEQPIARRVNGRSFEILVYGRFLAAIDLASGAFEYYVASIDTDGGLVDDGGCPLNWGWEDVVAWMPVLKYESEDQQV